MSITLETSSENISYAIGIDLGGTYIKSGIVDSKGKLVKEYKTDSYADKSPQKVISQIEKCINELKKGRVSARSGFT